MKPEKERKRPPVKTSFNSETAKEANKKSREAARRHKTFREWAKTLGKQLIKVELADGESIKTTWDGAVIIGTYKAAMNGDTKAAKLLVEVTGQAVEPTLNVNAKVTNTNEKQLTAKEAADFIAELSKLI